MGVEIPDGGRFIITDSQYQSTDFNRGDIMAVKKKIAKKKAAKPIVSAEQKQRITKAIADVEKKLVTNYQAMSKISGKSFGKESKKVKANLSKAKKTIEIQVRKNPAAAAAVAAALGVIAGAVIMSQIKKKK
jgi:hypothetical protein